MKTIALLFISITCAVNVIHGMDSTSHDDCQADFSYSYNLEIMCFLPCTAIQFVDNSPGEPVQWLWDFGDGYTSMEKNPLHIYTLLNDSLAQGVPSEIKVCLKVIFADGCISELCKVVSLVADTMKCRVYFRPYKEDSVVSIPEMIPYSFETEVPENTVSWHWDFGDGTVSEEPDPVHGYYFEGRSYNVCLTIATSDSCIQTYCTDLYVGPPDTIIVPDCQAGFTYSILETYPVQYAFYDSSYGDPESWFWDFGDGSFSKEPNPVHIFEPMPVPDSLPADSLMPDGTDPAAGSYPPDFAYRVCLTITTRSGCTSTYCQYIDSPYDTLVTFPCEYGIMLNTSTILGLPCSGTGSAGLYDPIDQREIPASVYWSTGESGSTVSGLCANMPYYVVLTTADGCAVAGSFAIMDYSVPVYPFGYWTYTGIGNEYRFTYDTPDSTYKCYWDFGDGVEIPGHVITHAMPDDGNNSVTLTVYDANGNLVHSEEISLLFTGSEAITSGPGFSLYPNPATDRLYLELQDDSYAAIDLLIVDMTGKQVLDQRLSGYNSGPYSIDIAELPGGLYLVRLMSEHNLIGSSRFVK